MRGELDWIVMKALEKDRNRRYETANGFAMDVQRYLAEEPVLACPPAAAYRLRKFARRNRAVLAVGVLLAVSVLVAVAGITAGIGWAVRDRAAREEEAAREVAARQAKVSGELERILDEVAQLEQAEKWAEALVSARRAQPWLAGDEASAEIRERVRNTLAELEFVQRLDHIRAEGGSVWGDPSHAMEVADREYAKAFREFGLDLGALPRDQAADRIKSYPRISPALIPAIDDWVGVRNLSKGAGEARRLVDVVNIADPDPWRQRLRSALANEDRQAVHDLARSADLDRQPAATLYVLAAALRAHKQFLLEADVLRRAQAKYPDDYWINHRLGIGLIWLRTPQEVAEGIGYMRAAVALRPRSPHAVMNLGNGFTAAVRHPEAEACYRKAIALDPKYAEAHLNFGVLLGRQGDPDGAIGCYRTVIELKPKDARAHNNLGAALRAKGDLEEAVAAYRRAIALDPKHATAHMNLALALRSQGEFAASLASLQEAEKWLPKADGLRPELQQLIRQGERLVELDGKLPAVLRGQEKPANAAEQLEYARLCAYKRLSHASARLFAAAFTADPKRADDLREGYRYDAACMAARTGTGQDPDAAPTDEEERTRWRQQALDWLRADLAYWGRHLGQDTPAARAAVEKKLRHWQGDRDLARLRDAAALPQLPKAEQEAWRQFWADVDALLERARGPGK
jgi:tetratricopeptide (TPR) repeat protein